MAQKVFMSRDVARTDGMKLSSLALIALEHGRSTNTHLMQIQSVRSRRDIELQACCIGVDSKVNGRICVARLSVVPGDKNVPGGLAGANAAAPPIGGRGRVGVLAAMC